MASPSIVPQACTEVNSSKTCDFSDLFKAKTLTVKVSDQVCSVKANTYQCGDVVLSQKFSTGFTSARLTLFRGKKSIETAQIYLPKPTLTTKGKALEAALETELTVLKGDSSKLTIQLDGKTYSLTEHAIINDLLAAEGSAMRVLIGVNISGASTIAYGEAQREELTSYNGRPVRIITLGKLKISNAVPMTTQALNDQESIVAVFSENSVQLMTARQGAPAYSAHYKLAVHQQVYREFFGPLGGIRNRANLDLFNELVGKHEKRHFDFRAKYGDEPGALAMQFKSQGIPILLETDADLGVLEHLLSISQSKPEEARRGLIAWSVYRGGRIATPGLNNFDRISEELISNLMLSAMEVKGGKIVVNWNKLRTNTSSFKQFLEKEIFEDLAYQVQIGVLSKMAEPQYHADSTTPRAEVKARYNALKAFLTEGSKQKTPGLSQERAEKEAVRKVAFVIDKYSHQPLTDKILKYELKIDEWMTKHFNFTHTQIPFRVSN